MLQPCPPKFGGDRVARRKLQVGESSEHRWLAKFKCQDFFGDLLRRYDGPIRVFADLAGDDPIIICAALNRALPRSDPVMT